MSATARGLSLGTHERWEDEADEAGRLLASPSGRAALARMPHDLVIDMDDTLISNEVLFLHSKQALMHLCAGLDRQGRSEEERWAIRDAIDLELTPTLGYTPARWFAMARQTAETIADRPLDEREIAGVDAAANLAMGVGEVLPGAWDALGALASSRARMVLKTKGERDKQQEKLLAHGFAEMFGDRIHIVDAKNEDSFADLVRRYGFRAPVSIGNSGPSDIMPAIAVGYRAVLVDQGGPRSPQDVFDTPPEVPRARSFAAAVLSLLR